MRGKRAPPRMSYTLYIARDRSATDGRFDMGSVLCMSIVKRLPPHVVGVQEAQACDRTEWLTGTPTLCSETETWTGIEAFEHLLDLLSNPGPKARRASSAKRVTFEESVAEETISEEKEEDDDDSKISEKDMKMLTRS